MWKKGETFLLKDKYIGPLIKKFGPCKIKPRLKADYFEELVGNIAGQQLSGKAADTIFKRVKALTKGKLTPENILKLKDEEIRAAGMSWAKVSYVKDLAERVKNNKLQVTKLGKLSDEEVMSELVSVKGIGRWTAEMFLMFTLGRKDVFPVDDLGIRNGMKKLLRKEHKPQEVDKFAIRWKPWRTLASWYVWALNDET